MDTREYYESALMGSSLPTLTQSAIKGLKARTYTNVLLEPGDSRKRDETNSANNSATESKAASYCDIYTDSALLSLTSDSLSNQQNQLAKRRQGAITHLDISRDTFASAVVTFARAFE